MNPAITNNLISQDKLIGSKKWKILIKLWIKLLKKENDYFHFKFLKTLKLKNILN